MSKCAIVILMVTLIGKVVAIVRLILLDNQHLMLMLNLIGIA